VHVRKVITSDLVERASKLQTAIEGESLNVFAEWESDAKSGEVAEIWKTLLSLFKGTNDSKCDSVR
jgi:protein transport protein SEC31